MGSSLTIEGTEKDAAMALTFYELEMILLCKDL